MYNIVLVLGVQQSNSDTHIYIYTHIYILFYILVHYR